MQKDMTMTKNLPTLAKQIPTPTPRHDKSMSPAELVDHRAKIAFEVKTVLSAYPQAREADEIKAAQLAWWCDELQAWTREQVVYALRKWNRENETWKPTPGNIVRILKQTRGKKEAERMAAARKPEPPKASERITPEAASEIMRRAGYSAKRMTQ
jgi:hypothetical protein